MLTKKTSSNPAVAMMPYGRAELKSVLQKNLYRGLIISVVIHLFVVGSYYAAKYIGEDEDNIPTVSVRILKYSDLGPPPSITSANTPPPVAVSAPVAKPTVGTPVPVPDAEVSPEATIATQTELSSAPSPAAEQLGGNENVQITQDIKIDSDAEPGMDEFIAVEKQPQIVKRALPIYPEMAMRAGLEGTVYVKILVDKDGKPKKAVVIKSSTEIFNDAAIEAAMQFIFTPAVMNNGPVKVWVSIPFKFKLKEASPS